MVPQGCGVIPGRELVLLRHGASRNERSFSPIGTPGGLHPDRAPGGDRDHRRADRAACCPPSRRPARPRGGRSASTTSSRSAWRRSTSRARTRTCRRRGCRSTRPTGTRPTRTPTRRPRSRTSRRRTSRMILPYMEQTVIYNQINLSPAASDTVNIPPCVGSGALHSGLNSVYSVAINAFLCPSSPGSADDQLLQHLLGSVRRRRRRRLHAGRAGTDRQRIEPQSAPDPDLGPDRLLPDPRVCTTRPCWPPG